MNEQEQALEFNAQLDRQQSESVASNEPGNYSDLLELTHTLSTTDFSDETSIRQSLLAHLTTKNHQPVPQIPPYRQHPLAAAIVASLFFIGIIFTLPPVRALAQEVIKRLQTITLTNGPSLFEPYLTATPTPDAKHPPVTLLNLPLDEAIAKAGFTPLVPAYLPAGYELTNRSAAIGQVTSEYEPAGTDPSFCCVIFSIRQLWITDKHQPYQYPVGNVPIVDVLVRNVSGLWVQNAQIGMTPDANGKMQIIPANLLTWEEDSSLFWVTSFDARTNIPLSKEEMLKVANSLQMPTPAN